MNNINFEKLGVEAILITNPKNIRHFTGLKISFGFVVLSYKKTTLFVDGRYIEIARKKFKTGEIILYKDQKTIKSFLSKFKKLGYESDFVTVKFKKLFEKWNSNLVEIDGQELRIFKDKEAIESLKKAVKITKKVMKWVFLNLLKPGISEKEISRNIVFKLKELGSEDLDYQPIVASGPNSSLPHANPSDRKIQKGETIMFDFGAVINGYTADITRNYSIGKLKNSEIIKIKKIVKKSQMAGIKAIKPGITGKEIDAICRKIIIDEGYGDNFKHSTGHGLGRDVHELPLISKNSKTPLKKNYVITIEPGIYLESIGGIRIEDNILVTENSYEIL